MGYSPWGLKEPDMIERLSMHAYDISNYQVKISAISGMRSMFAGFSDMHVNIQITIIAMYTFLPKLLLLDLTRI